jgi:hypothetical protein
LRAHGGFLALKQKGHGMHIEMSGDKAQYLGLLIEFWSGKNDRHQNKKGE